MNIKNINGWYRLGIVASIVFGIWHYNHVVDTERTWDFKLAVDNEFSCMDRGGSSEECDAISPERSARLDRLYRMHQEDGVLETSIYLSLAWAGAFLILFVSKWILRGFRRQS